MNTSNDETSNKARLAYLDPIRSQISLQQETFFSGVFDLKKVSLVEGLMGKLIHSPVGDFRDWEAISSWGRSIFSD